MSNFTRNLLQTKDNEIAKQKAQITTLEDNVWSLEHEIKLAQGRVAEAEHERRDMQTEMETLQQARERAEANVTELKDKLREEILKH